VPLGVVGGMEAQKQRTELRGEGIVLRPVRADDAARLVELASHPEVDRWWLGLTEADVVEQAEGRGDATGFAIVHEDEVIGLIQYYEETDPMYRHAGIDLFIGEPYQGRGLGTDILRTMIRHLIHDRGHHRLVIDPAAANERAIRTYEKVGFRRVGVMRDYERGADGTWHDGVLLDLLARDLP
jgi:aminoglycoside 6'-N-acetyltransferase